MLSQAELHDAEAASNDLRSIAVSDVAAAIQGNSSVICFSNDDEDMSKLFDIQWLEVQRKFDANGWSTIVPLAKVSCSPTSCKKFNATTFPSIHAYQHGKWVSWISRYNVGELESFVNRVKSGEELPPVDSLDSNLAKKKKKELKRAKADFADRSIRQLEQTRFFTTVQQGVHAVFFGANYCPYTQKFTPTWLAFQELFDSKPEWNLAMQLHKVQCAHDEDFCIQQTVDGYPSVFIYEAGAKIAEIDTDDLIPSFTSFMIQHRSHNTTSISTVNGTVTQISGENTATRNTQIGRTVTEGARESYKTTALGIGNGAVNHVSVTRVSADKTSIRYMQVGRVETETPVLPTEGKSKPEYAIPHSPSAISNDIQAVFPYYSLFAVVLLISVMLFMFRRSRILRFRKYNRI